MDVKERMKELIERLNEASKAYYAQDREIMSNYEYDALYDELTALEDETGIVMSNSPTVNVGYEAVDKLQKNDMKNRCFLLIRPKTEKNLRTG